MPFRDREQWLRDIVQATDDAESFILGLTFEQYAVDALRKSAAERKLLAASEAAIRLGADAPELIPEHDWRGLRAIGNVIRHAYDVVDDRYI